MSIPSVFKGGVNDYFVCDIAIHPFDTNKINFDIQLLLPIQTTVYHTSSNTQVIQHVVLRSKSSLQVCTTSASPLLIVLCLL